MYIFVSSIKNIRRYAGRYALFGILFIFVLAIGTLSLTVADTIDDEIDALLQKYGASVFIETEAHLLTPHEYAQFEECPQVSEIVMTRFVFEVYHDTIHINDKIIDTSNFHGDPKQHRLLRILAGGYLNTPAIAVLGIDIEKDPFFNYDFATDYLITGRLPNNDAEVLVNSTFCEIIWGASPPLGSTLTLTLDGLDYQFSIVGIFDAYDFTEDDFLSIPYNPQIILPFNVAHEIRESGILEAYYQYVRAFFDAAKMEKSNRVSPFGDQLFALDTRSVYKGFILLHDYTQFDAFSNSVENYGKENNTEYTVQFTTLGAANLITAYESTAQICTFFLTAVIAISAVVILIMTALAMHERRYEIGVLLSVGMGKGRIALLFAVENLIFTLAVTALAYAVGLIAAPAAADKLLEGVVTISRAAAALPVAARMLALAVGLSLPASLISSLAILAYKPMTILRSRS